MRSWACGVLLVFMARYQCAWLALLGHDVIAIGELAHEGALAVADHVQLAAGIVVVRALQFRMSVAIRLGPLPWQCCAGSWLRPALFSNLLVCSG